MKNQKRREKIINLFLHKERIQSSAVHVALMDMGEIISLPTIKRELSQLVKDGSLLIENSGRSTDYKISSAGRVFSNIDAKEYCSIEPDKRYGLMSYNFSLFQSFPSKIFTTEELVRLESATSIYVKNTEGISPVAEKKELERMVIELSWKSSKIEGNTYTLLDTEKLILENTEAKGHNKEEARMILNHKDAFHYVREHKNDFSSLTRKNIDELHYILTKDLNISRGLRTGIVGVTGSKYRPLDNVYQVTEAVDNLSLLISKTQSPYEKALLALVCIGYIQPFEDGNKRTSRLMCNALLLAHSCSPLSYRSVDENEYREAMLVFYELNSLVPIKKIFIDQYQFAALNYAVK